MGDDGAGCCLASLQARPQTVAVRDRGDRCIHEGAVACFGRRKRLVTFVLDHIGLETDGVKIIDDVCLEFEPGSLNVLLGPTLAGKTTIMRLMAGLDRPTSGRLLLDGRDLTGLPVRERSVAMVYQQFIN